MTERMSVVSSAGSGISRATGRPLRVIWISSPLATRSSNWGKCVFASYPKPSNASDLSGECQTFQVTHPFHPLRGRQFTLVTYRRSWGEHHVYFHDDTGRLVSLPAQWTSVFPADPYVAVAAGRAPFRLHDLLELSQLIARIRQGGAS